MDYAVGDTQGAIGYMFLKAIGNELRRRGVERRVVAIVTQTVVDAQDPAFAHPTKPVGSFLDDATAHEHARRLGWHVAEDAGRGWRRVVPSPAPVEIVELQTIRDLLEAGVIVVAGGGGGISVVRDAGGDLVGVEAVVDKDSACALMAAELGATCSRSRPASRRVAVNFGQARPALARPPDGGRGDGARAQRRTRRGQHAPEGRSARHVPRAPAGGAGVITSPQALPAALRRETGTWIEG